MEAVLTGQVIMSRRILLILNGTYGSQNTSGQIDIENLKKENQKNKTEKQFYG